MNERPILRGSGRGRYRDPVHDFMDRGRGRGRVRGRGRGMQHRQQEWDSGQEYHSEEYSNKGYGMEDFPNEQNLGSQGMHFYFL